MGENTLDACCGMLEEVKGLPAKCLEEETVDS